MVRRQDQRGTAGHRQPDNAVAGRGDLLVGGQPLRKFLCEERFPLIGVGLVVEARRRIPVGVEAGLPADGHHRGDPGVVEPLERRGVDVPAVVVVAGAQPVEQIHGLLTRPGPARAPVRRLAGTARGCCAPSPSSTRRGTRRANPHERRRWHSARFTMAAVRAGSVNTAAVAAAARRSQFAQR